MPRLTIDRPRFGAGLLFAVTLSVLAAAPHTGSAKDGTDTNLLCNSDFASQTGGRPDCWTVFPVDRGQVLPDSGNMALYFTAADNRTSVLSQAVPLPDPSGSYRLEVRLKNVGAPEPVVGVYVDWLPPGGGTSISENFAPPTTSTWSSHAFDLSAQAGAACARIRLHLQPGPGDVPAEILVDDFRFVYGAEVPTVDPASCAATPTATPSPSPTLPATATTTPTGEASPTATPAPPPAGLRNGSFEEADGSRPRYWNHYGGYLEQSARFHADGLHAAALTSTSPSTNWAYQVVPVQGGAPYQFSAYVLSPDPNTEYAFLRVSWYASEDGSGRALLSVDSLERVGGGTAAFTLLTTGPVTAPEAARSARLRLMLRPRGSRPTTVYFDAATFIAAEPDGYTAPEPTPTPRPRTSEVAGVSRSARIDPLTVPLSEYAVRINEVAFNVEAKQDERAHEWVELYNPGEGAIRLEGWALADNARLTPIPPASIPAGGFLVVAASGLFREDHPNVPAEAVTLDGLIGNGLANAGDRVLLLDHEGRLVDAMSYGRDDSVFAVPPEPAGHATLERRPFGHDSDEAEDFVANRWPTPGFGLNERPRAVEVAGARAGAQIAGIVGYRLPEDNAAPPFLPLIVGLAILSPVLTVVIGRFRRGT